MNYIFNSRCLTLTIVLKPSSRTFIGTEVINLPGITAHFDRGLFQTEDEATATLLRKLISSGREKEVVELTNLNELFYKTKKAKNQRGPITADATSKAMSATVVAEKDPEKAIKCVICEKEFKNQKALNMHLVSHRPGVQLGEKETLGGLTTAPDAKPEDPDNPQA